MGRGKGSKFGFGEAVVHATTRHDQRFLGTLEQVDYLAKLTDIGARPSNVVHDLVEETNREVPCFGADVLWQANEGWPAVGGVEHGLNRVRQRTRQLLRTNYSIPVPRDRPEAVVDGLSRITKVLDLLQHRVGNATRKRVTRNKQQRQAVAVRNTSRGDHVRSTRTDRARRHHDLTPTGRLGIRDTSERHAFLGLPAVGRQLIFGSLERMAKRSHIAMTKDRIDPGKQRRNRTIDLHRLLRDQILHDRLRSSQSNSAHTETPCTKGKAKQSATERPGSCAGGDDGDVMCRTS